MAPLGCLCRCSMMPSTNAQGLVQHPPSRGLFRILSYRERLVLVRKVRDQQSGS
ncbi:unnamed protein product [Ectocarpus sp. 13 AM-2016]